MYNLNNIVMDRDELVNKLEKWIEDKYVSCCESSDPAQLHGYIAGSKDGGIYCFTARGSLTSEELWSGEDFEILSFDGECYDYVETDAETEEERDCEILDMMKEDACAIIEGLENKLKEYDNWRNGSIDE